MEREEEETEEEFENRKISWKYWNDWPMSSCEYVKDLTWAAKLSAQYLQKIAPKYKGKNALVVSDFDDCICWGDTERRIVKDMELGYINGQEIFILPPNRPIVNLLKVARQLGFKIVVLTARPPSSKLATITNLNMFDIPYDQLIMNDEDDDNPLFKVNVRRRLAVKQQVILTIGDQYNDVLLPGRNCAAVKLPDPDSKVSYIYIPPGTF